MTKCNHKACPHGHWSSHRHCNVADCAFVEDISEGFGQVGHYVEGFYVCPAHAVLAAMLESRSGKKTTLAEMVGHPTLITL